MSLKSGQSLIVDFTTQNASGAATDADATPVGTLVINGTDDAATVTVTNKSTGSYKAAVTLPALGAGDGVQLRIAATIGGTAAKAIIFQGVADTQRASDVKTAADAIKSQTDKLQFSGANDVKATLDGESVAATLQLGPDTGVLRT